RRVIHTGGARPPAFPPARVVEAHGGGPSFGPSHRHPGPQASAVAARGPPAPEEGRPAPGAGLGPGGRRREAVAPRRGGNQMDLHRASSWARRPLTSEHHATVRSIKVALKRS